jgi:hypothetical protein
MKTKYYSMGAFRRRSSQGLLVAAVALFCGTSGAGYDARGKELKDKVAKLTVSEHDFMPGCAPVESRATCILANQSEYVA